MSYIFMDESGDLGFDFKKSRTSKYFVISFMFSTKKEPVEKVIEKIFKSLISHKKKPTSKLFTRRQRKTKNSNKITQHVKCSRYFHHCYLFK